MRMTCLRVIPMVPMACGRRQRPVGFQNLVLPKDTPGYHSIIVSHRAWQPSSSWCSQHSRESKAYAQSPPFLSFLSDTTTPCPSIKSSLSPNQNLKYPAPGNLLLLCLVWFGWGGVGGGGGPHLPVLRVYCNLTLHSGIILGHALYPLGYKGPNPAVLQLQPGELALTS